jgi:PAS domain S-box-containing protein
MQEFPPLAQLLGDARVAALVAAPSPAFLIDSAGRLHFANRSALALVGARTLAEAVARGPDALGSLADTARELIPTLSPSGAPRLEHLRPPGDGFADPIVFAVTRFSLHRGGEAALLVGIDTGRDRSLELRLAVAALLDGEAEPMALLDWSGRTIHANSAAAHLLGTQSLTELDPAAAAALADVERGDFAAAAIAGRRALLRRVELGTASAILAVFAASAHGHAHPHQTTARHAVRAAEPHAAAPAPRPPKLPTRFVWQMDAEGRFSNVSPDLAAVVGVENAAIVGLDWPAVLDKVGVADNGAALAAIARRDTWSGVTVLWPVAGTDLARPVDLAALPVFDRERHFLGYRGFGVFHDPVPQAARAPYAEPLPSTPQESSPAARPPLALVEQPENVVPLRTAAPDHARRPALTAGERNAFREIARVLGTKLEDVRRGVEGAAPAATPANPEPPPTPPEPPSPELPQPVAFEAPYVRDTPVPAFTRTVANGERAVLDRLPLGIAVHRAEQVLYANRMLLDWIGLASVDELNQAGGLRRLFAEGPKHDPDGSGEGRTFAVTGRHGEPIPVEARLLSAPWEGESALVYVLRRAGAGLDERLEATELALREAESTARELRAILDTATDGVLLLDRDGRVLNMNRSAEALFGFDAQEVEGQSFTMLFAPESRRAAVDYLDGLASNGVASVLNDGREVLGRVREGGLIPLFMTLGRVRESADRFCAVFRDISQWKRAEQELVSAKRDAEQSSSHKSDFLALNAIIGFAEVMAEERFGPVGNQRYREYLKDIQTSGAHLISLINDLLDLSKIEAGKLELAFAIKSGPNSGTLVEVTFPTTRVLAE